MTAVEPMRRPEDALLLAGLGWSGAEAVRSGQEPVASAIDAAATLIRTAVPRPLGDIRATGVLRLHLAEVLTCRALAQAIIRAGGARADGERPSGQRLAVPPWTVGGMP